MRVPPLFSGLEQAFGCFGGVPQEMLFDQMRSVIVGDQRLKGGALVGGGAPGVFAADSGARLAGGGQQCASGKGSRSAKHPPPNSGGSR